MRARCLPAEYIRQWEHFIRSSFFERFRFSRHAPAASSSRLRIPRSNSIRCAPHACPCYPILRHITVLSYTGAKLNLAFHWHVLPLPSSIPFHQSLSCSTLFFPCNARYAKVHRTWSDLRRNRISCPIWNS